MMKINWTKNNEESFTGNTEGYTIEISRQPHEGWAYELFFETENTKLILSKEGYISPCIESLHAVKYHSLKKLNFFYAQQYNQEENLQK